MRRDYLIYTIISIIAVAYNLATLHNQAPWLDEVMICDTPANYYLFNAWETKAYYGGIGASIYMPLYGFLSLIWYNIFGFSFIAARFLNIFLFFILGFVLIETSNSIIKGDKSKFSIIIFSSLFWFTYDLAMLYRDGRPDVLCALLSFSMVLKAIGDIKSNKTHYLFYVVVGCLLLMSGLQACVFVGWIALFSLCAYWEYRNRIIKIILLYALGCSIGGVITLFFMYKVGVFNEFVINTMYMSSTLWKCFLFVAPFFTEKHYGDIESVHVDFFTKVYESFDLLLAILYLFTCSILLALCIKTKKVQKSIALIFVFPIFAIFTMNLSGHYYGHYSWMVFCPLLLSFVLILKSCNITINSVLSVLVVIVLCIKSIPHFGNIKDKAYDNLCAFIQRQPFEISDKVVSPMAPFYELKPKVKDCYFAEIYPSEKIPQVDYFIRPIHNVESDKIMNYYKGAAEMDAYFDKMTQDKSIQFIPIDTCQYPYLILYKVLYR